MILMAPTKMLDAQQDLQRRAKDNPDFISVALQTISQSLGLVGVQQLLLDDKKAATAATLMKIMWQSADEARCYHVSRDMCALIQNAAAGLDQSDIVDFETLAPNNYGLIRFDGGGLDVMDPRGELMKMDWLLWGDCAFVKDYGSPPQIERRSAGIDKTGFVVWEFNDRIDNPDAVSEDLNRQVSRRRLDETMGRWSIMGSHVVESGTSLGPAMLMPEGEQLRRIVAEGDTPIPATNSLRLLHAFWLLLNQPITESSLDRLPAPARKKAKSSGMKRSKMDKEVTVVQLRRSARRAPQEPAEDRHVKWRGRWYVNGFWRWQAYGPGRKQRKRIWVEGYIKGPQDKPIVVRKHVYSVRP